MNNLAKQVMISAMIGVAGTIISILPWTLILEENLGLSLLFWMRGSREPPMDVLIVSIDHGSIRKLGLPLEIYKWPRSLHAQLVEILTREGAALIVFDVIFDEPQDVNGDLQFAHALKQAGNVVLAQSLTVSNLPYASPEEYQQSTISLEKLVSPIPMLAESAVGMGPFPLPKIPVRLSQFWLFKDSAGDLPTLPVVAFHAWAEKTVDQLIRDLERHEIENDDPSVSVSSKGEDLVGGIRYLRSMLSSNHRLADSLARPQSDVSITDNGVGDDQLRIPLIELHTGHNSRYLNFYGPPGTVKTIPFHRIIHPPGDGAEKTALYPEVRGKVVFVGQTESSWPQTKDGFYTVFSQPSGLDISGVELAASAFGNMQEGSSVEPLAKLVHVALVLIWGIVIAVLCLRLSTAYSALCLLVLASMYFAFSYHRFVTAWQWFPLVVPLLVQLQVTWFAFFVWSYRRVSRERRNIREAFGYYLPNKVVDKLAENITYVHDEGSVLYGTVLFTDAERYTTLSETMDPASLTKLMNQYYEVIFRPIKDKGGLILQVVGDSVLALWPAPEEDVGLKNDACEAALEVAKSVEQFNRLNEKYQLPIRIGLHAGTMVLSNIGAMDHYEYRPVGDIVNTASRLEGLNKVLGTQLLVSSDLLTPGSNFYTRPMGKFIFKGKLQPVTVHQLVSSTISKTEVQAEQDRLFAAGLDAFQHCDWDSAKAFFARVLDARDLAEAAGFFMRQCEKLGHEPPDSTWEGAVQLTRK